jgi:enoyl-CoA hydratase/carnithine racemase
MRTFDIDDDAYVAIRCGRGRAFCSGADVRKRPLRAEDELRRHGGPQAWGTSANEILPRSVNRKRVVAAVHGSACALVSRCNAI